MAVIANVALTNTFDTWRTRTNVGFTRLNQFAINESSLYANTVYANVAFTAKGTATVTGLLTASGRATVGTNLTVSGNTTFGGANKTSNTTGWFGVLGRASVSTNLHVAGNTFVMGSVGIGTSSPVNGKLSVYATTNAQLALTDSTLGANYGGAVRGYGTAGLGGFAELGVLDNSTYTKGVLVAQQASSIQFYTGVNTAGNAERMRIASSGLVTACNSMTVTQNLTVSGNTTINGTTTDRSNALNQTLTDAATITWDTSLGRVATVTLGASRTIAAPTNQKVGTYILRVIQGGTGSYTLTWNGNYKWTAQTAPVLSTAVGAVDIITLFSDGSKMYGSYLPDVR